MLAFVGACILPAFIGLTVLLAIARRINVFDEFVEGATAGLRMGMRLIPFIIGINIAIGLFRESGILSWISRLFAPLLAPFGLPPEIVSLVLLRPFSSEGAMVIITDILRIHGPDSLAGLMASIMQGSSETTFYVLTLYLGSVGIRRSKHVVSMCLLGDVIGFITALFLAQFFFSHSGR